MSLRERLRCLFTKESNADNSIRESALQEITAHREEKIALRSTLDRTGYPLGDAVFARIDRRPFGETDEGIDARSTDLR